LSGHQSAKPLNEYTPLDWRDRDDEVGWRVLVMRQPLADLVGGEAGRNMREQFA
jgi:hypothetical protein